MADDIFGLPEVPLEEFLSEETTPQAADEESVTGSPEEQDPYAPVPATTTEEEQEAETAPEGPKLWANKYNTPEDLERGYNESREMWRRASEARAAEEQRALELEAQAKQYEAAIQQAIPYIQQAAQREQLLHQVAREYYEQIGQYPQGYQGPPSAQPQAQGLAPQQVAQLVEQRLAQERQVMAAQQAQAQEVQQLEAAVTSFYTDHPEVRPGDDADTGITDTLQALNEAWANAGWEVDPTDRGSLEVLYEASQRPALQAVFALKPEYFGSEQGLTLARMEASVLEGASPTQEIRSVPASQVGSVQGQRRPFSESAAKGAPAPTEGAPNDPWAAIKAAYRSEKSGDKASVFFE